MGPLKIGGIRMITVGVFLIPGTRFHIGVNGLRLFFVLPGDHNRHHLISGKISLHVLVSHDLFQSVLIIHEQDFQRFRQFLSVFIILLHIHHSVKAVYIQFQRRIDINTDYRHRFKIKLPSAETCQNNKRKAQRGRQPENGGMPPGTSRSFR